MIPDVLPLSDIVISSTASPLPIIGKGMVERAIKIRKHRPMYMVDVAVPRDIEPEVGKLPDVYLYCIDDLNAMAMENRKTRTDSIWQAEHIIARETQGFMGWLCAQPSLKTLRTFREYFERIRDQEMAKAGIALKNGKNVNEVLEHMAYSMTNKFMHMPTVGIRDAIYKEDKELLNMVVKLFNLEKF
jgi:glutamyl-tRNA reductase